MLKIGVLGAGHLGKIHLKCIGLAGAHYELAGVYDPDRAAAEYAKTTFGVKVFDSPEALIDAVEVVDIVTPTPVHFELAKKVLEARKHLFIEKPLTETVEQAEELVRLSREKGVKVQVGHVERFNPAILALGDTPLSPMFVEGHRLATFNSRGTDVSVVLDLMIHDLDIVLSMIDSPIKHVYASGVAVVSESPDIANARLEFENGAVANLTASRISLKQMRKIRLFQRDAYISLDLLDKNAQVVRLRDDAPEAGGMELETPKGKKYIELNQPAIEPVNAIKMELETLAESIQNNAAPRVSIEAGYEALKVAYEIARQIHEKNLGLM